MTTDARLSAAMERQVLGWQVPALWDGAYNARCPCGVDATWNAYRHEPLCTDCSMEMER